MYDDNFSTALDIYNFLVKCKEDNIKNIIFDITLNEGGDTITLAEILGLMTNKDIEIEITNVITKEKIKQIFKIDTNYDGNFLDNDAFDNFNYFVLTSDYSFSCANIFSNYCRNKNLATILGQKTGGGACAITRVILPTGACFQMSGLNGFYSNESFLPEFGTKPDIEFDYKYIYGEKTILSAIDETNNKK